MKAKEGTRDRKQAPLLVEAHEAMEVAAAAEGMLLAGDRQTTVASGLPELEGNGTDFLSWRLQILRTGRGFRYLGRVHHLESRRLGARNRDP